MRVVNDTVSLSRTLADTVSPIAAAAMAMTQTQSPWTYTSPMELPLTRGLNSSGSESSIDSGFESPLSGKVSGGDSPVSRMPVASLSEAITTSGLETMLVRGSRTCSVFFYLAGCVCMPPLHACSVENPLCPQLHCALYCILCMFTSGPRCVFALRLMQC